MDASAKEANTAAKLLRALKTNAKGGEFPASIVRRLLKLDLDALAKVLEGASVVPVAPRPESETLKRYQKIIAELRKSKPVDSTPRQRSGSIGGGFSKPWYQEKFPHKTCPNCRRHFVPRNPRAKTCSVKCRVAMHRKRNG